MSTIILGKWVSCYNNLDKVIFLKNDYKIYEGIIYIPSGWESSYIVSNNLIVDKSNILVLANIQSNSYYKENPHSLYECLIKRLEAKIKFPHR